ncbi:hypothetical protein JW921_09180, partial [Candidatus Fermentibacterales bacterium]|nr:hypothetical protein [Candidatus Fermentibacterales bacterium]
MLRLGTVALLALVPVALLFSACGEEDEAWTGYRQISVTGNGTANAEPDVARVILGIDLAM